MKWTSEKALGELLKWKLFSCSCSPASLGKLPANLRPSRPISSHPFAFTPVAKISPVNHPFQKSRSWANQVYPKATSIISFPKTALCCTQGISGRFPLSVGHLSPSDPQRINFFLFFFFPSVSLPLFLVAVNFLKLCFWFVILRKRFVCLFKFLLWKQEYSGSEPWGYGTTWELQRIFLSDSHIEVSVSGPCHVWSWPALGPQMLQPGWISLAVSPSVPSHLGGLALGHPSALPYSTHLWSDLDLGYLLFYFLVEIYIYLFKFFSRGGLFALFILLHRIVVRTLEI